MKKKWIHTICIVLVCSALVPLSCGVPAVYAKDDGVYKKLISLQEKFPDGKYWNHIVPAEEAWQNCANERYADSYTDYPCTRHGATVGGGSYDCNYFDGGLQCCGFAKKVFYDTFGERESSGALHRIAGATGLSVGDYVRFKGAEHYAIVLTIADDTFTVVECNLDGMGSQYNCMIRWGREYRMDQVEYYVHSNNYDKVNVSCKHKYKITKKVATLTKNGSLTKKCTKCGDTIKETFYKPATIEVESTKVTYTGKAIKPSIIIKDSEGRIIPGKYYSVTYSNYKAIGKASATVKFKGNYSGTKQLSFMIVPKGTQLVSVSPGPGSIDIVWKKQTSQTTGYQIQYATNSEFTENVETTTVSTNKLTGKKIRYLYALSDYYVRVRTYKTVDNKKYTSAWSEALNTKTEDIMTKMIDPSFFKGIFYGCRNGNLYIYEVTDDTVYIYETKNKKKDYMTGAVKYKLQNQNGETDITFYDNCEVKTGAIYFYDWDALIFPGYIGVLHKSYGNPLKYELKYSNGSNEYTNIKLLRKKNQWLFEQLDGTWHDLRDQNNKFGFNQKKGVLEVNMPVVGGDYKVKVTNQLLADYSEYTDADNLWSLCPDRIIKWRKKSDGGYQADKTIGFARVSEDCMIAITDASRWDSYTVFRRIK